MAPADSPVSSRRARMLVLSLAPQTNAVAEQAGQQRGPEKNALETDPVGKPAGDAHHQHVAQLESRQDGAGIPGGQVKLIGDILDQGREVVPGHVAQNHGDDHGPKDLASLFFHHVSLLVHCQFSLTITRKNGADDRPIVGLRIAQPNLRFYAFLIHCWG